jgi:hypothetical protein
LGEGKVARDHHAAAFIAFRQERIPVITDH